MATEPSSRRATCHSCSKPTSLCLCTRIKTPNLNNSIAVTILQHTLEQKHPLNSTRIAALGLRNVNIIPVSDVNFEARFVIWPIRSDSDMGFDFFEERNDGSHDKLQIQSDSKVGIDYLEEMNNGSNEKSQFSIRSIRYDSKLGFDRFEERNNGSIEESRFAIRAIRSDSEMGFGCFQERNNGSNEKSRFVVGSIQSNSETGFSCFKERNNGSNEKSVLERFVIDFLISKYGVISPDFDLLFDSPKVLNALAKGFVVKKWNNKLVNGSTKHKEFEEFEIEVPPGSALLFPSENSVGIEAIDFDVKNLIVLDGTWAKAKRIYSENPWLKVLPHLKLDLDKMSLYSEVRHQPRAGYLSTIESIVYAMKGLGDQTDGLDHLLDVFESMVGDQRRCKKERLSKISAQ